MLLSASEKPLISIRSQQFKQAVPNTSKSPKPGESVHEILAFLTYGSTLYLLVSSADQVYKQFGPRSGPTKCRA